MLKPPGFKTGLPVIVLAASLANTQAQTTWTGAIDHDWHNAGNWSNGLPAVGNMPAIGKAGAVVNLTQNVTVSGGTIFNVRSIDSTTGTEPATLDISANLDLSGNAFEVGSRYTSGNPNPAFYQGVVNQTAGEVKASYLKLALRGGIVSAPPSEYHLSGGKLTLTSNLIVTEGANTTTAKSVFHQTGGDVTVGGDFRQGGYQGSGTYLMESVTIDSLRGDNSSSTSLPGALWTTFTGDDVNGVKVELNSESLRGTLDASTIGNEACLSGSSSVGFTGLTNFATANQRFFLQSRGWLRTGHHRRRFQRPLQAGRGRRPRLCHPRLESRAPAGSDGRHRDRGAVWDRR